MGVAQGHSNIRPSEDRSQCESIGSAVSHASGCRMTQVVKAKVLETRVPFSLIKPRFNVDKASLGLRTRKDIFADAWLSFQHFANGLIHRNKPISAVLRNANVNRI